MRAKKFNGQSHMRKARTNLHNILTEKRLRQPAQSEPVPSGQRNSLSCIEIATDTIGIKSSSSPDQPWLMLDKGMETREKTFRIVGENQHFLLGSAVPLCHD